MQEKYGIIDIGSNTMRLVIYDHETIGRFKEIENIKAVTRLRNYVDEEQKLNDKGLTVLIETLQNFEEIICFHRVPNVRVVATATIRNARNQQEVIAKIKEHTNLSVRVLSEYEEAYYGYLAIINSTSITEGVTIDIGGGSTEVTYFKDRKLVHYHSFQFGVLSLRQQFIAGLVPTSTELSQIQVYIRNEMASLEWLKNKQVPLIAIGGSARNVAQIDQRRKLYPLGGLHQYEMNGVDLYSIKEILSGIPYEDLRKVEGLSEDRADIIIPAIEVFHLFYQVTNATSFILSRKGLRDGVFFEELLKPYAINMFPNVIEESLFEIGNEYEIDINNAMQVSRIAKTILILLRKKAFPFITDIHLVEAKRAAYLFHLGRYIDDEASSQHTFYLLANRTIDGLMHQDRLRLAAMASYKSRSILKQYLEPFQQLITKDEIMVVKLIGAIIRFADALNKTKRNIVEHIEITEQNEQLTFTISCLHNWQAEYYQAQKQKKHLEKILKQNIKLHFRRVP